MATHRRKPKDQRSVSEARPQGMMHTLRDRLAYLANPAGWVVIILCLIGVGAIIGDLPHEEKDAPSFSLALFRIAPSQEYAEGGFLLMSSKLTLEAVLPQSPMGNTTLKGELVIEGASTRAGTVGLEVLLPRNSNIVLQPGFGQAYERRWEKRQYEIEDRGVYPGEFLPDPFIGTLTLKFGGPCEAVYETFNFTVSDPSFSHTRGWGRQDLRLGYQSLPSWTQYPSLRRHARHCQYSEESGKDLGQIIFRPRGPQRVASFSPASSEPFLEGPTWRIPTDGQWSVALISVENDLVRFWVSFATQLLLVAVGALLGRVSLNLWQRPNTRDSAKPSERKR